MLGLYSLLHESLQQFGRKVLSISLRRKFMSCIVGADILEV